MQDEPDWLNVSRETLGLLKAFESEVLRWNKAIQLVSKSNIEHLWQRHILDSAQLYFVNRPTERWVDIGSGGGFPALVLAIMAKGEENPTEFVLIESDQRKAAFLRSAAVKFDLNAEIIVRDAGLVQLDRVRTISARALAKVSRLFELSENMINPHTSLVFMKGRTFEAELKSAKEGWEFSYSSLESKTDPDAQILTFQGVKRA